jgi:hypothetical protein
VTRGLSTFGFRDRKLAVVESVNRAGCRQAHHRRDEPLTPEEAADPAFDLRGLAKRKESAVRRGLWLLNKITPPAISFESYDSMKTSSPSIRAARRRGKPIHAAYSGTIALAYTWKGAAKGDPLS